MTYKNAREYLDNISKSGIKLGLERLYELLKRLDNPEKDLKFIHVAGTNGKGSTVTFISNILKCAGYKVGTYTSPRVFDYEEFAQINHVNIKKRDFSKYVEIIKNVISSMELDKIEAPSLFEIETALAFLYFKDNQCDVVVLECGMGGASDATNVVNNILCNVITSISLDHTNYLGNSLESITRIKAGIIKDNSPVCISNQEDSVINIIKEKCNNTLSRLTIVDTNEINIYDRLEYIDNIPMIHFDYKDIKDIYIKMLGRYQIHNAALAIDVIKDCNLNISDNDIKKGLINSVWPGRFEIISTNPLIIIDGAHNVGGIEKLKESLEYYYNDKNLIGIMGVFKDKDYPLECKLIGNTFNKMYTITPYNQRALDSDILCKELKKYNKNVKSKRTLRRAINSALKDITNDDVIVIFGSLSIMKDLKSRN